MIESASPPSTSAERLPRAFGPYTLLRVLGRGSSGTVYEALNRSLGRREAVKILPFGFDVESNTYLRFRREAPAAAQVRHDHIVEIYDADRIDGVPYYSMELVVGDSLATRIEEGRVPAARDLCREAAGIADALHALHAATPRIVHRDVKPSNIMVRASDGRMKLCDFGLARTADAATLTERDDVVGTLLYLCPEALRSDRADADPRTDVYGLGATLYHAVAGRPVFQADECAALLKQIADGRPKPLRDVVPGVPPDLDRIVWKALEKRREDRYASAAEMRDDLLAFAGGGRVSAPPLPSRAGAVARAAVRHWVSILAVLLVAALATAWSRSRPAVLAVATAPTGATVVVDGVERGTTPLSLELSPGTHTVVVRLAAYGTEERTISLESGESQPLAIGLVAQVGRLDEALPPIERDLGVRLGQFPAPRLDRGGRSGPAAEAIVPRGDVRVEDVRALTVAVDERFAIGPALEMRIGDRLVWSAPFEPTRVTTDVAVPESVLASLRPGDVVTWGLWAKGAVPATASFRVVEPDAYVGGLLARCDRLLGPQPGHLREHFRARAFLDRGLFTAAFLEARAVSNVDPSDARTWAVMLEAMDRLDLSDSSLASKAAARLRAFPDEQRARVYDAPSAAMR